jgi:arylsulfatase A-like enzyme
MRPFVGSTWVGVLASACLFAAFGCERTDRPIERPDRVLLVTVDTLRADHVGDAGRYPEPPMPFVDALLARGTRFTRAVTPLPRTTQALASLLTGHYPHRTGVRVLVDRLEDEIETVAQMAQGRGYRTVAVVSNHLLTGRRGLDRGFDVYDAAGDIRGADATTEAALASVREIAPETPLFLWVHYIDPHVPYHPPKALAERFDPSYRGRYKHHFGAVPGAVGNRAYPRDLPKRFAVFANPLSEEVNAHIRTLYAADVRFTDDEIARLVRGLEQRFGGDWLFIVTADHGESLGEHDFYYDHGDYVYEASIRVPLGFVLPGADRKAGRVVEAPVSLVDVTPTLVELLELLPPEEAARRFEGRSLVPYLRGQDLPARPVFAECGRSFFPGMIEGRVRFDVQGRFRAVVDGDWKLIWTPGRDGPDAYQLYDVAADPDETRDLSGRHPERVRDLRRKLEGWMVAEEQRVTRPIPDEEKAALRALGYIDD